MATYSFHFLRFLLAPRKHMFLHGCRFLIKLYINTFYVSKSICHIHVAQFEFSKCLDRKPNFKIQNQNLSSLIRNQIQLTKWFRFFSININENNIIYSKEMYNTFVICINFYNNLIHILIEM